MKPDILNRFCIAILLLMWMVGNVNGQESSLLWKVSGNGLEKESYLFGTIHIICAEQFLMDDRIKHAFQSTQQLIMELDMSDPSIPLKMAALSMNPGMKNNKTEIEEEDAKKLDEFLIDAYGTGLEQLGILKPFVLTSMVLVKQLPCSEVISYEEYFTSLATEQRKPIKGLETIEYQMGIFDQIPVALQLAELIKMVKGTESEVEFRMLVNTYLSEDIDSLYAFMTESELMREYQNIMLDDRNRNWVIEIKSIMKTASAFFAVGGGHLGGENGLINLLRKAGYDVEPVKN